MKELVKQAILASGVLRLGSSSGSAAILMYHSVMQDPGVHADSLGGIVHSESEFGAQMELLARDYHPLSLDEVLKKVVNRKPLPKRSVVVTFDDGYADNHEVAMPILDRAGIQGTFYVTVDCIEKRRMPWPSRLRFAFRRTNVRSWKDSRDTSWEVTDFASREQAFIAACGECCRLSGESQEEFIRLLEEQLQCRCPEDLNSLMMTYEQLKDLARHGHIVGSHTMTHPNMAFVSESEARIELVESKKRLEDELKTPIQHFSYPCPALSPHWNERTIQQCREAGYTSAVTTKGGVTHSGDNPLSLKRIRPTKTAKGLRWNLECAFAGRAV